jgi:8-oxo-dGTP pyrophosphatase MutT (NUDIX family)
VVVALVNRNGELLLRSRDRMSAFRPNRWSLPGGGMEVGESPDSAAARLVREQTRLEITSTLRPAWHGRLSDPLADVFFLAAASRATVDDLPVDRVPGATARFGGAVLAWVPGPDVLSGRSFTPVSGYLLPNFLFSALYHELAAAPDLEGFA